MDRSVTNFEPALNASAPQTYVAMVLLVDDQIMIGETVRRALVGEPDIEFHFCADPNQAIALAEQISPTVILQDLVMPGVDGLSLVRRYRLHPSMQSTPVIVLSSREDPKIKGDAFAAGANDYLVKLPDRIELIARIRYHTRAHLNQLQRDEAYRALRQSQRELLEANLQLQRLMNMDGLTGLNNRRRFDEYVQSEWSRAMREQTALSLLLIDVDHFKLYNDAYGHLAGDQALKRSAAAIQASCQRPADLAARFGGEEFGVVLPGTAASGARQVAEAIRNNVQQLQIAHARSSAGPYLTVSVGGATVIPQGNASLLEWMARADEALYEAKRQGRDRTVVE